MKFYIISLVLALFAVCAMSVAPPQRSVLVSYSKDTPEKVLDEAKKAIIDAGGFITHEYKLIRYVLATIILRFHNRLSVLRGFAANAPTKILENVQSWGSEYNALIEEDQQIHAFSARPRP
ncbi:hypothetical protein IWX90DRAFT_430066 [Phyllosticta citrichinensis]|uniref:Uncharacterized protein n=1 Tax=Phyllosticta citrichinensis TaxID=1130410 RepID=A0ABR1XVX0_9PEZI